ncbi:helix-turn-helix domain-containing protein [Candidatus Eisenbacteria bacterium]|uniref:Helix-turn-helix domain-containing protein n=1 Tax=Eiseniibacteriota bacterium TaxID=2212470 RepID=A0ABV6YI96_UNCEI
MKSLGALVRDCRKKGGITQIELARLAGVGKTSVYDIEKDKTTVQLETLLRVLVVVNIRLELHGPMGDVVVLPAQVGRKTEDNHEAR